MPARNVYFPTEQFSYLCNLFANVLFTPFWLSFTLRFFTNTMDRKKGERYISKSKLNISLSQPVQHGMEF